MPAPERRSPTPAALRKRDAIRRLKEAQTADRFFLHFQPIVGAREPVVPSAEALLRWRKPATEADDLTHLFMAAERSPAIFRLENWTLRQALGACRGWQAAGLADLRVQVNLSAREFPRADLVRRLQRELRATGLEAAKISLEITETSWLHDFQAPAEQLRRLMAIGVELWLDDFGTGHSSLEWLSHLPTHGLKIPTTFVARLFTDDRCQVIVRRMIDLAHDLGLRVIAEGVECEEQRAFLAEHGCDLLQGFFLYAPMPAEALPAALAGRPTGAAETRRPA
jgi:EAL domain-containing protein (putative c-di-GMP-specific phosphodiesterase class I)